MIKKPVLIIGLTLAAASSSMAASPFIPKSLLRHKPVTASVKPSLDNNEGDYANFSGHWVGTCDDDLGVQQELNIEQSPDSSSINMGGQEIKIDGVSTLSSYSTLESNTDIMHLRWNADGQQLLGTFISYFNEGNLSQEGFNSLVGKVKMALDNGKLITNATISVFIDGSLLKQDITQQCIYNKA